MIPCGHEPGRVYDCPFCSTYRENSRYRSLVDSAGGTPALPSSEAICIHRGDDVLSCFVARMPLDVRKKYVECGKGRGEVPGIVCDCKCNASSCSDYCSPVVGAQAIVP